MKPLVSILMPVKNAMPYLVECLDSICAQSYDQWELIAINDGSDDDSRDILMQYAQRDDRIRTSDNDGAGIIPALQLAYRLCRGSLITRMDADDIMSPNKLEVMAASLMDRQQVIAVGQVEYFSTDGVLGDGYRQYQDWLNRLTAIGNNFSDIYKECVIPSPCWMMHRVDLDAIGGFQSDRYPEDYDLAFRMYRSGYSVCSCSQVIHRWRDYPHRTSRTDDNYADNRFLDLKVHYFIKIDHSPHRQLILWGAGKKGKNIAQLLLAKEIPFKWICDNPKKIGHNIYGVIMEETNIVSTDINAQVIVAVAGEGATQIQKADNLSSGTGGDDQLQWFWFC